ncbi:cardiolipin synthase ClsB [Castellaniella sp. S9]|uniref:cardiolipin synthase ClsB n=1 Tax=Castellaniella sp. S9 TaxID=2993652 RepID=UPI0022B53874|nr:cardiolipin synthase ClsB [Castellaniella sp. S9]
MQKPLKRIPWREGNQLTLLRNGEAFFPALCAAIDEARHSIHLETYIFAWDETGKKILEHLARACARGVKVRLVVDGFGCQYTVGHLREICARMGAQLRVYRPEPTGLMRLLGLRPGRLRRMHRKTAVIDRRVAFIGGINIIDDYETLPIDTGQPAPRFDFALRLRGPVVRDIILIQGALWLRMSWRRRRNWRALYGRVRQFARRLNERLRRPSRAPAAGPSRAMLLLRDNVLHRQTIENAYLQLLAQAQHRIIIANAYFFPGRRLRKALTDAAHRGVRIDLLLQGQPEYPMQYRAGRYTYQDFLDRGMILHEYMASFLHAKVAVIDDKVMIGSSNLDPFSLLLAREANILSDDADLARALCEDLRHAIDHESQRIRSEALRKRGRLQRLVDALAYAALRAGVLLTGQATRY